MTYRVEVTPEFEQDLGRLDPKTAHRVLDKVEWLAAHPEAIPAPIRGGAPPLGVSGFLAPDYVRGLGEPGRRIAVVKFTLAAHLSSSTFAIAVTTPELFTVTNTTTALAVRDSGSRPITPRPSAPPATALQAIPCWP